MSNQNLTSTLPKSQTHNDYLYRFYSEQAQIYADIAADMKAHGLAEPAVLAGQRQLRFEALAARYEPVRGTLAGGR